MSKKHFQSKSGKSLDDVRNLINKIYILKRCPTNSRKYTLLNIHDDSEKYFRFMNSVGEMYEEIKENGIEEFWKEYKIDSLGVNGKNRKAIIEARTFRKNKKKTRSDKKKIEELINKKHDVAVQLMNLSLKKGSKKHKELKAKLHALHAELLEIPEYETFEEKMKRVTIEEMMRLQKQGEKKKAEKKAKKKQRSTKIIK